MNRYRVVQWATGVVGSAALRGIVHHPQLDLVGVKVYDEAKAGRDAGGVTTTTDVDEILALGADAIVYCPMPWDVDEMCRLLESGSHLATPCPYWFPFIQDPDATARLTEACRRFILKS